MSWKEGPNSSMWLSGIPGCGKSILSSGVIHHVQRLCDDDPDTALAYFFFDFNDPRMQHPEGMIKSLIAQISAKTIKSPAQLLDSYRFCFDGHRQPTPQMLLKS
jgi:hypothetical protein